MSDRIEFDWNPDTLAPRLLELRLLFKRAGVADVDAAIDALEPDALRLIAMHGKPEQAMTGTLFASAVNRQLEKAAPRYTLVPEDGGNAWLLKDLGEPVRVGGATVATIVTTLVISLAVVAIPIVMLIDGAFWQTGVVVGILVAQHVIGRRGGDDPPTWVVAAAWLCNAGVLGFSAWTFHERGSTLGLALAIIAGAAFALHSIVHRLRAKN